MISRLALTVVLLAMPGMAALAQGSGEADHVRKQVPGAAPAPPFQPEFQFSLGPAARWPGKTMHWLYNAAGAPPPFSSDPAGTVLQLSAAAAKWSATCGIQFVYDGPTTRLPYDGSDPSPDNVNVVGWRDLVPGTIALTYTWNGAPPDDAVLVDADIVLSPSRFQADPSHTDRTGAHEWGHAIGIGHSNLSGALMSGLPDSPYSSFADPQPDDVRACRCLYGAAAGQLASYACSLPNEVNFGVQTVGVASAPKRVTFTNDSTATLQLAVTGTSIASGEFYVTGTTCMSTVPLSPGAGCTIDIAARVGLAGTRTAEAVIATSDGPYRLPLTADGYAAPVSYNYQGLWWKAPSASEDGWGINFAHQGRTIFGTWFTYDTTGKGWWLTLIVNDNATPGVYKGDVFATTGPPFDSIPFVKPPSDTTNDVGDATLTFTDANNGSFHYVVNLPGGVVDQTKAIARQALGAAPSASCTFGAQPNLATATNYQDIWWAGTSANPGTEQGWGINFAHQGDVMFASWFTYDLDRTPLWLVATLRKDAPGVYSGDLFRPSGPRFDAYDKSQFRPGASVGQMKATFADGNNATFDYEVQLTPTGPRVVQQKSITREVFAAPGTACR